MIRAIEDLEEWDLDLGKSIASEKEHPAVRTVSKLGKLGDQGPLYAASAVVTAYALIHRNLRLVHTGLAMFAAVAVADLCKTLVKRFVRRTRPHVFLDEGRYASALGGSEHTPEQSFPSGHMAGSVAAARALARNYPASSGWSTTCTVIIGITRLIKGAHWPLDLAAGAILGLVAEGLSAFALQKLISAADRSDAPTHASYRKDRRGILRSGNSRLDRRAAFARPLPRFQSRFG